MRITIADVESQVSTHRYIYDSLLTICVMQLKCGFKLVGFSACIDPSTYDRAVGEKLAYEDALDKVWELEAYYQTRSRQP